MRRIVILLAAAAAICGPLCAEGAQLFAISQKGRAFSSDALTIAVGDTIRFTNEDGFLHQVFVDAPRFKVDSDEQRPGEHVDIKFPVAGTFHVLCAIHPKMALEVTVK